MLTRLRITNYRSIRGTVDFPLTGHGLILLNGEHDSDYGDSNGAGKSSTYMALMWCLFGWLGKQKANKVVNRAILPWRMSLYSTKKLRVVCSRIITWSSRLYLHRPRLPTGFQLKPRENTMQSGRPCLHKERDASCVG